MAKWKIYWDSSDGGSGTEIIECDAADAEEAKTAWAKIPRRMALETSAGHLFPPPRAWKAERLPKTHFQAAE